MKNRSIETIVPLSDTVTSLHGKKKVIHQNGSRSCCTIKAQKSIKICFSYGFFKVGSMVVAITLQLPGDMTACETKQELSAELGRTLNNKMRCLLCFNSTEVQIYRCTVHAIVPAWIPAVFPSSPLNPPPEWKQAPPCCFHTPRLIMWNSWEHGAGSREVNEELQ